MSASVEQLPKRGERLLIKWPGGLYDFVIEFEYAEPVGAGGWRVLHGLVVEPDGPQHRQLRGFYVRPVPDGYTLLPKR